MSDLIKRSDVIKAIDDKINGSDNRLWLREIISELPSAKRTGHWILCENRRQEDVDNGNYLFVCSECGFVDIHSKAVTVSYCWNCGAYMRGESHE